MTLDRSALRARLAAPADRQVVLSLMHSGGHIHAHLDWKRVEDWLGDQPFLLAERGPRILGALAFPPAPADTAWLRFFAVVPQASSEEVWHLLWPQAREILEEAGVKGAAGLSLDGWLDPFYRAVGFEQTHNVVVLSRPCEPPRPARFSLRFGFAQPDEKTAPTRSPAMIRRARPEDDPLIGAIDTAAFVAPWQKTSELIQSAIAQANYVTVAEVEGQIVGYQLSTPSQSGAHMARLAVRPEWQRRGIGAALVVGVLEHYRERGAREITVNTQDSNSASIRVYQRLGFTLSGVRFPVFQLDLR